MAIKELIALAKKFYEEIPGGRQRGLAVFTELEAKEEKELPEAILAIADDADKIGASVTKNFVQVLVVIANVTLDKFTPLFAEQEIERLSAEGETTLSKVTQPSRITTSIQAITTWLSLASPPTSPSEFMESYKTFIAAAQSIIKVQIANTKTSTAVTARQLSNSVNASVADLQTKLKQAEHEKEDALKKVQKSEQKFEKLNKMLTEKTTAIQSISTELRQVEKKKQTLEQKTAELEAKQSSNTQSPAPHQPNPEIIRRVTSILEAEKQLTDFWNKLYQVLDHHSQEAKEIKAVQEALNNKFTKSLRKQLAKSSAELPKIPENVKDAIKRYKSQTEVNRPTGFISNLLNLFSDESQENIKGFYNNADIILQAIQEEPLTAIAKKITSSEFETCQLAVKLPPPKKESAAPATLKRV